MDKKITIVSRVFVTMLMLLVFAFNASSQIKKISTSEIEKKLIEYGIDSAMTSFRWYHAPIYKLDSTLYIRMTDYVDNYSSRYSGFVFDGANNIQNPLLAQKVLELVKDYTSGLKKTAVDSKYKKVKIIDKEHHILLLLKQDNDSIESFIKNEYDFWKNATEIRNKKESHYNSLKMMLALKEMNSSYYSESVENFHRENVSKSSRDSQLKGYSIYEYNEHYSSVIALENEYSNLGEINFEAEKELSDELEIPSYLIDNKKCWSELIYKDKKGILDLGCQFSGLSGYGNRYVIELVGKNKLKVSIIGSWIS
jgi:hypothetical protein